MKKIVLFTAAFILITWALTSCEMEKCKFCKLVTTDNTTGDVTEGGEIEYCGAKLIAIEAIGPKTVGCCTTEYVCR